MHHAFVLGSGRKLKREDWGDIGDGERRWRTRAALSTSEFSGTRRTEMKSPGVSGGRSLSPSEGLVAAEATATVSRRPEDLLFEFATITGGSDSDVKHLQLFQLLQASFKFRQIFAEKTPGSAIRAKF